MKHLICLLALVASFSISADTVQKIKISQQGDGLVVESCRAGEECAITELEREADADAMAEKLADTINDACESECEVTEKLTLKERSQKIAQNLNERGQKISQNLKERRKKIRRNTEGVINFSRKAVYALYQKYIKGNDNAGAIFMY